MFYICSFRLSRVKTPFCRGGAMPVAHREVELYGSLCGPSDDIVSRSTQALVVINRDDTFPSAG
jgi:hypothetical protein